MKKFVADEDTQTVCQTGNGLKKKDETGFIPFILRLARANAYDEGGRIKATDGTFVEGTHVSKLVALAFKPEQYVAGIPQFCDLLKSLGVERIPNENLGVTLGTVPKSVTPPPTPPPVDRPTPLIPPPPPLKRMVPPPTIARPPSESIPAHDVPLPSDDDEFEDISPPRGSKRKSSVKGAPPKKRKVLKAKRKLRSGWISY